MDDGRIIELYQAGQRVEAIASEVGCATGSVYRVLRRNKVALRDIDEARIIQLYQEGVALGDIASTTKASLTSINRVLARNDVPRRQGRLADRQEQIVELYKAGVTIPEIERQVGCGRSSVWRAIRRADVPRRREAKERPVPLARRTDEIVAAYESGRSMDDIGAEFDASGSAIRNVLLRRGVKIRTPARRPRVFTAEELERIRSLREGGASIDVIVEEMRSHFNAVRDALLEMGLAARPRKPRVIGAGGYVYVRDRNGEYVLEHRHVMALAIGRPLRKTETVHHINGDIKDNRLENLQLRQGRHGKGVVMTCNACGSHDIQAAEIAG